MAIYQLSTSPTTHVSRSAGRCRWLGTDTGSCWPDPHSTRCSDTQSWRQGPQTGYSRWSLHGGEKTVIFSFMKRRCLSKVVLPTYLLPCPALRQTLNIILWQKYIYFYPFKIVIDLLSNSMRLIIDFYRDVLEPIWYIRSKPKSFHVVHLTL